MKHNQPHGVGLAYRPCLHEHVMRYADEIDVLEIPTEDYIIRQRRLAADPGQRLLREALDRFPCMAHGISMSIGSVEPLDKAYMRSTRSFLDEHQFDVFSEHLAYHRMDGVDLTMFLAMPFEEVSVQWLAHNYEAAKNRLGRSFALENVSYYFPTPHCSLDEADFLTRLTELTDCSLLLDVTNIYNNAVNHGYDPLEFIRRLPGERVSQLHLAGGHYSDGMWQDSHSAPVIEEVWGLLDEALAHTAANIVVLERDSNFTPFENVMRDIRQARWIFLRHRPEQAPACERDAPRAAGSQAPAYGDANAEAFRDLRNYQRATLREITDETFRGAIQSDPAAADGCFPMAADWRRRWRNGDPRRIEQLARKWEWIKRDTEQDEQQYRRDEWQAWVRMQAK